MGIIQKLAECDLGREIYHSDGNGHVQVQLVSKCGFETPAVLIEQIEQAGLWLEFFEMAKTKGDDWILRVIRFFPENKYYSTMCFVEFLSILTNTDSKILLIQDSPTWFWDESNAALIEKVITIAERLIESINPESIDSEIDLSILNRVIQRLEEILAR